MPGFKRMRSRSYSNSSFSSQNEPHKQTQSIGKGILSGTKIYIVPSKLGAPKISRLSKLAETHTIKLCENVEEAEVVLTAIGMQKRLERHIPSESIVSCFRYSLVLIVTI
jgi:DNA polymerase mu